MIWRASHRSRSTALLDPVHVEVYGANMPLNQVATVSTPEARMLSVQVWDRSNVQPVEKAIRTRRPWPQSDHGWPNDPPCRSQS